MNSAGPFCAPRAGRRVRDAADGESARPRGSPVLRTGSAVGRSPSAPRAGVQTTGVPSGIPELLERMDAYRGQPLTRLTTQLTLLIFIRSSELRFARWSEIDFDKALWTIPPERKPIEGVKYSHRGTKMRTEHLVPLSRQALDILKQIHVISGRYDLIFTGDHNPWKPMSENTVNNALRLMGYDTKVDVCGHGFRAMACSSLIESGLWSRDAVERQMSHQERNGVRAAYIHKAEFMDERRLMLQWWGDFLDANRMQKISPFDFARVSHHLSEK